MQNQCKNDPVETVPPMTTNKSRSRIRLQLLSGVEHHLNQISDYCLSSYWFIPITKPFTGW